MAVLLPSSTNASAFAQNDSAVHGTMHAASHHKKMLQQRELALKRQQNLTKGFVGAIVKSQLDTPFDAVPMHNKMGGWEKMLLRCGIDAGVDGVACGPEKISVHNDAGFVRIRVPCVEDYTDSCVAAAVALDVAAKSDVGISCTKSRAPLQTEMENSWGVQTPSKAQEKPRNFRLWRPWGFSKRTPIAAVVADTIEEERRVSICSPEVDGTGERCTALSSGRAATPFRASCDESLLEESIGSESSLIPGIMDGGKDDEDDSLEGIQTMLADDESNCLDDDRHSVESGVDHTLKQWQAKQTPDEKSSPFKRFIPTLTAPRFRRPAAKTEAGLAQASGAHVFVMPRAAEGS